MPLAFIRNFSFFIKLALSVSILAFLYFRLDKSVFADIAHHFQASAWAYAIFFVGIQSLLLALRWQYLVNIGKPYLTTVQSIQIHLTSQLANMVFITSIGGVVARIALTLQHGAPWFKLVIAALLDRVMTLAALLILTSLFLPGAHDLIDPKHFHTLVLYTGILMIALFIFAPIFLNMVIFKMPVMRHMTARFRFITRYLRLIANRPVLFTKFMVISLAAQMAFFLSVYCLIPLGEAAPSFAEIMIVLPVIALIASLPISVGGWGVREGAFVYGLGLLGVPMETAFIISVQVGLVGIVATILLGLPSFMTMQFQSETFAMLRKNLSFARK